VSEQSYQIFELNKSLKGKEEQLRHPSSEFSSRPTQPNPTHYEKNTHTNPLFGSGGKPKHVLVLTPALLHLNSSSFRSYFTHDGHLTLER